ncbi:hypothetical protein ACLF9M_07750 [Helicobacter pylori]
MDALTTPLPKDWEAVKVEDIFEIITDFQLLDPLHNKVKWFNIQTIEQIMHN